MAKLTVTLEIEGRDRDEGDKVTSFVDEACKEMASKLFKMYFVTGIRYFVDDSDAK